MNWSQTDQPVSYDYDLDGRLTKISDPALSRAYNYDAGNRITSILDGSANIKYSYEHDKLDRLLKQNLQDISLGYAYDANSNRTQSKITKDSAVDVNNISYEAGSNRIKGVSYDASGRILNDGSRTYTYNPAGRIERIQSGAVGVFNVYNPIGQRIQKNSGDAKTYFSYDESGQLIGEYGVNGEAIREYVYLGGQPIAMMSSERPDEVLQIHSDHLGTPRAVSNANNEILWKWEGDAFGTSTPSIATVKMPLRMAGQYADDETGLFYNYYRFYDPATGRYVTSDPIGLNGGMNTYLYAYGNGLMYNDPYGLFVPPSIPQDSYEVLIGYSDALSFSTAPYIRKLLDIDAGVNNCSFNYKGGRVVGTGFTLAVNAYGAIPRSLTHYTTAKGAVGIAKSGIINPSRSGLFGGGVYASSIGRYPANIFVPKSSTIPINIVNTTGFVRAFPGTFLKPTTGLGLIPWNIGYAGLINWDLSISMLNEEDDCGCQ